MVQITAQPGIQPAYWYLCFVRRADQWWVRLLSAGRYSHVRAYTCWPGSRIWLFYEASLKGTELRVAADGSREADVLIAAWQSGADVMEVRAGEYRGLPRPPVYSCVALVKALIGSPSGALRPDRFWRDCLAAGGRMVSYEETSDRPGPSRACAPS
jgi:hypothetical protein